TKNSARLGVFVRPRVSSLPFGTAASDGNVVGKGKEMDLGLSAMSQRLTSYEKNRALASLRTGGSKSEVDVVVIVTETSQEWPVGLNPRVIRRLATSQVSGF